VVIEWMKRRRFRKRVLALMDPFLAAMTEPGLVALASRYREQDSLLDDMWAEGIRPEQAAAYGLSAILTNFIAEIGRARRADVLSQVERYAEAATVGKAASAMPTDELGLLLIAVEARVHDWAERGLTPEGEAELVLSELLGALNGASPHDRTMGRFIDFLESTAERNRDPSG